MYYNYHMHCDFSDDSKTPMKDMIKQILSTAIYDEKGIKINTSCFRYNLPDLALFTSILKLYKELGEEILTIGSDSHNTNQVGNKLDIAYKSAKYLGSKYICKFNKMKP